MEKKWIFFFFLFLHIEYIKQTHHKPGESKIKRKTENGNDIYSSLETLWVASTVPKDLSVGWTSSFGPNWKTQLIMKKEYHSRIP